MQNYTDGIEIRGVVKVGVSGDSVGVRSQDVIWQHHCHIVVILNLIS